MEAGIKKASSNNSYLSIKTQGSWTNRWNENKRNWVKNINYKSFLFYDSLEQDTAE